MEEEAKEEERKKSSLDLQYVELINSWIQHTFIIENLLSCWAHTRLNAGETMVTSDANNLVEKVDLK